MLTSIEVENYRGIHEGRIDGFGSVNLFTGPNGSGKSTLLEAIFVPAGIPTPNFQQNPAFFYESHYGHPGSVPLIALRHNEGQNFPTANMWFRKDPTKQLKITYHFGTEKAVLASVNPSSFSWSPNPSPQVSIFSRMKFLDIRVLLDKIVEQRGWDQLLNTRGDRELVKVMNQVYSLNLESFSYSGNTQALKALFTDRDYALNIDDLGVGMRTALRMFTSILLTKDSIILGEEFDGYQHNQTFPAFVKALFSLSRRMNTQLFLATHSFETLRAFVEESKSSPAGGLKIFQTALSPDGIFKASSLTAEDAEALIAGGFDLRKTF
jgi:hypothetical protein